MTGKVEISGSIWAVSVKATKGKEGVSIGKVLTGKLCIEKPAARTLAALCVDPPAARTAINGARVAQGKVVIPCTDETMFVKYRESKGGLVRASSNEVTLKQVVYDALPDAKGESKPTAELHYVRPFRLELLAFSLDRLGKETHLEIEQKQGELALKDNGDEAEKKGKGKGKGAKKR